MYLFPVQHDRIIIALGKIVSAGQFDSFAVVPFVKSNVAMPADAVFIFQKGNALGGIMALHEVGVDAELALGNPGAAGELAGDFILGDKCATGRGKTRCRLKCRHRLIHIGQAGI